MDSKLLLKDLKKKGIENVSLVYFSDSEGYTVFSQFPNGRVYSYINALEDPTPNKIFSSLEEAKASMQNASLIYEKEEENNLTTATDIVRWMYKNYPDIYFYDERMTKGNRLSLYFELNGHDIKEELESIFKTFNEDISLFVKGDKLVINVYDDEQEYLYSTNFYLSSGVTNLTEANEYLQSDDMEDYAKSDPCISESAKNKIIKIWWELKCLNSGYIYVKTNSELTEDESLEISEWISGQCADGLGSGFREQDFARSLFDESCAEFDWRSNNYTLSLQ